MKGHRVRVHHVRCFASHSAEPDLEKSNFFFFFLHIALQEKGNREKEKDINNEAGTNFSSCVKWT